MPTDIPALILELNDEADDLSDFGNVQDVGVVVTLYRRAATALAEQAAEIERLTFAEGVADEVGRGLFAERETLRTQLAEAREVLQKATECDCGLELSHGNCPICDNDE